MPTIYEKQFTKLYSLSKTIRFELKPVGETAQYISDFKSQYLREIVQQDTLRFDHYKTAKDIIDDYHRSYIEERLSNPIDISTGEMWITPEHLEEAFCEYENLKNNTGDQKIRETWGKAQADLRKYLVKSFSSNGDLFKKELITRDLPALLKQQGRWEENKEAVESFNKFTTYFTGFHDNRKNMYSDKEQSTAIAYRLMNENLPRFFNNYISYQKIQNKQTTLALKADAELLKKMGVNSIDDIFQPRYFIKLFTQSGIDNYQELLGGKTDGQGKKSQGLNEQINLYNQQQAEKKDKLPRFTSLYKQILSDRETHSFIPESFSDDKDLLKALQVYIEHATKQGGELDQLEQSVQLLPEADSERVYVKAAGLTDISSSLFNSYGIISAALWHYAENVVYPDPKNKQATVKKRESFVKQKVFSIAELDRIIVNYIDQLETGDPLHKQLDELNDPKRPVYSYFIEAFQQVKQDGELDDCIKEVQPLLSLETLSKKTKAPTDESRQGGKGYQQKQTIQKMLDAFMAISHKLKPLHLLDGRKPIDMPDMDTGFYAGFAEQYEAYADTIVTLYNKTRNHLTKKPFSRDKIKLNFENPDLLAGWDINRESACSGVLLKKDENYYLAIMRSGHRDFFKKVSKLNDDNSLAFYEKINYKQVANPGMDVQNLMIIDGETVKKNGRKSADGVNHKLEELKNKHLPEEINRIRVSRTYSKASNDFSKEDLCKFINYYQERTKDYFDFFTFSFKDAGDYADFSEFTDHVNEQAYQLWFTKISAKDVDDACEAQKLFLFQIYNKDFSPHSKGRPNLHTLFWKGLFEPENLKDVVLKLNGEAEIFYRQHSIKKEDRTIHPANEALDNKNDKNPKKQSTFDYDIIKDRRYTQDKFHFHVPITLNFKAQGVTKFNDKVNRALQQAEDIHVIGIDRGERHLLYYTVINSKGEIIEQDTLNTINTDQGYSVDYQQKLDKKEKAREKARKSWSSVENIKELKAGYLSHVVHKLAELIIKYNAIVCLEDLNFGFKRGRFHVEKQVYQKFEKALIDKLNYLVIKSAKTTQAGHYLNAYQLTAPFESFEKLGKQSGILFYVQAAYTSKIDPATGFIDFLKPKYESLAKSKAFFDKIDSFKFNAKKDYFEIAFDYQKTNSSQKFGQYQTKWTACTFGNVRYHNKRNEKGIWETVPVNVTQELKQLFDKAGIQYHQEQDLTQNLALEKDTKFYKTLFWLMRLTLSLRHSVTGTDEDFILSPIADQKGVFFDSRNAGESMPKDADANGAYNIALKGLWNLQQIEQWDGEKRLNLAMKNEDWFSFIAAKPYQK